MSAEAGGNARGPLRRFRDAPNDAPAKTLLLAASVCLVCSLVTSVAAVSLRPLQLANRDRERREYIEAVLAAVPGIDALVGEVDVEALEVRIVDLESGEYAESADPSGFDPLRAAKDPARSIELTAEQDLAGIGRRERHAPVYVISAEGEMRLLILPVRGSGYLSTLYGYVALGGDTDTILGLTFYEHEETPGLGAEVENPKWLAKWKGKRVRDADGRIRVRVVNGTTSPKDPGYAYEVDGIAGATMTGDGVTHLLRFWLGSDGFGPYLEKMRAARSQP